MGYIINSLNTDYRILHACSATFIRFGTKVDSRVWVIASSALDKAWLDGAHQAAHTRTVRLAPMRGPSYRNVVGWLAGWLRHFFGRVHFGMPLLLCGPSSFLVTQSAPSQPQLSRIASVCALRATNRARCFDITRSNQHHTLHTAHMWGRAHTPNMCAGTLVWCPLCPPPPSYGSKSGSAHAALALHKGTQECVPRLPLLKLYSLWADKMLEIRVCVRQVCKRTELSATILSPRKCH